MNKIIFMVDDQPDLAPFIQELLSHDNYLFQYINSGQKALETLKMVIPDLILLDVQMPEMDGIEVCKIIKANSEWKYIPVMMLTGLNTIADLALCLAAGADDFIAKPFNTVEFKARVRSMLRIKEQFDQLKESQIIQGKLLKLLEGELTNEKKYKEQILNSLDEVVIVTDKNGIITYANNFNINLFEKKRNSVIGEHLNSISKFKLNDQELEDAFKYITDNISGSTVKIINSNNRESIVDVNFYLSKSENEKDNSFIMIFKDITKRYEMDKLINYQFSHDSLTGLLNRNEFDLKLQTSVKDSVANNNEHVLLYLDLDQFKIINDSHGYPAGNELLKYVSGILKNCLDKSESLFRIGGDEFTIILENCEINKAVLISNKIMDEINKAVFSWKENSYTIGVSIGIFLINKSMDISSADKILTFADNACSVAKRNGRNRFHVFSFDDTFLTKQREEIIWFNKIKSAIKNNNFCLYFQEVKAVKGNNTERAGEILIRMTEGEKILSPYLFIPVAEQFNKMVEIDQWVIENSFSFISNNQEKLKNILFKINLSGQSLGKDEFITYVSDCFVKHKINFSSVCFEITETATISNLTNALNFINFFKKKGSLFSLDDFGSGLSSFGYLKNLPVDFVKIDGSFVREINTDKYCLNMVEAINNISHSMNLKTIAEFVEDESIYNKLLEINIDYVQGYYISKPKPIEELVKGEDVALQRL